MNADMIMGIKSNYLLEFNEEEDKIEVSSKFNVTEEEINESVG